jgi:hypothetical protein
VRVPFIIFGFDFDGCSSVVSPLGVLVSFLSEEVWDESSRVRVSCLTQNLGCSLFHYFWGLI